MTAAVDLTIKHARFPVHSLIATAASITKKSFGYPCAKVGLRSRQLRLLAGTGCASTTCFE